MPRFTIDLTDDQHKDLDTMSIVLGVTKTEIVKRALSTYKAIKQELNGERDAKLYIISPRSTVGTKQIIIP